MKTIKPHSSSLQNQRGMTTLAIVVLLLAVLGIVSLFAARQGVVETQSSYHISKSQIGLSVAEAGLNQGIEFIKANTRVLLGTQPAAGGTPAGWLNATNPKWQPCSTALATGKFDPCLAEPSATRRATMYRYVEGTEAQLPLATLFGQAQAFTEVGPYESEYRVGAVLCRMEGSSLPISTDCRLTPTMNGPVAITLVSQGGLTEDGTRATVSAIVGSSKIISNPPEVPLIAAGIISGLGSAEIIPNPNAGGFGVPLSVWSNTDVDIDSGGSFRTCHMGEFMNNYTSGGPVLYEGIKKCEGCSCKGLAPDAGLLSGKDPSDPGLEGMDIMDKDGNTHGVLPDTTFFPKDPMDDPNNIFDDSVFEYTMGVDTTDEGASVPRMTCPSTDNPSGNCEDQFLFDIGAKRIPNCGGLTANSSGAYWVTGDCTINGQVGTPSNPVLLIAESCLDVRGQTEFYGMMFTRSKCPDADRAFNAAGGGQIYGAIVAGGGVKIRGSVQMIYNAKVLSNLGNSPEFMRYGFLPSSWTDNVCMSDNGACGRN